MVIVLLLVTIILLIFSDYIMHNDIGKFTKGLFQGPMNELSDELLSLPENQWSDIVASFNEKSGYQVSLLAVTELNMRSKEKKQLETGELVHKLFHRKTYKLISGRPFVIAIGPVNRFGLWQKFLALNAIFLLTGFAITVYIWARPVETSLKKLRTAADEFGNGDFSTRVHVNKKSALNKLACTFNLMAEQLEQSVSTYQELIGSISHELRTPLARLVFGMEMFQRKNGVQTGDRYFDGMQKDVKELEQLVSELMAYARFDPNILQIDLTNQPLNSWLTAILEKERGAGYAINLSWSVPDSHQPVIAAFNEKALQRAVDNLLRNAFKYAESEVNVTLENINNTACIHVDNNGAKISEDERNLVFDAFVRLDNQPSNSTEGHGLGLAIVQRIVSQHDGSVVVTESSLNGTCFTICLPAGFLPHNIA